MYININLSNPIVMNPLQEQFIQRLIKLIEEQELTRIPKPEDGQVYQLYVMTQSFLFRYMYEVLRISDCEFQSIPMKHRYPLSVFMLKMCLKGDNEPRSAATVFNNFSYNLKKPDMLASLRKYKCTEFKPWITQHQDKKPKARIEVERFVDVVDALMKLEYTVSRDHENRRFPSQLMNIEVESKQSTPREVRYMNFLKRQTLVRPESGIQKFASFCDNRKVPTKQYQVCRKEELVKTIHNRLATDANCDKIGIMVESLTRSEVLELRLSLLRKYIPIIKNVSYEQWKNIPLKKLSRPIHGWCFNLLYTRVGRYYVTKWLRLSDKVTFKKDVLKITPQETIILDLKNKRFGDPISLTCLAFMSLRSNMLQDRRWTKMTSALSCENSQ